MAKYTFEMSWNYSEEEYEQFLKDHKLTHLKSHKEKYFKVGDALRSEKGAIARIMDKFKNYENCSMDYTIANNKLDNEQMYLQFGIDYSPILHPHDVNMSPQEFASCYRYVSPEIGYVDQDEEYY
jgi:hypothetical protein